MKPQQDYPSSKLWAGLFLSLLAMVVAVLGFAVCNTRKSPADANAQTLSVETMTVTTEDIVEWFEGYGRAKATESVPIVANVSSRLVERMGNQKAGESFDPDVVEGQVLARLEEEVFRHALFDAQTDQEIKKAQLALDACVLRAPMAGRVQRFLLDVGDRVVPGTVLCNIVDPGSVRVLIQLPTLVFDHIRVGAICLLERAGQFAGASRNRKTWEGAVTRIEPARDHQARLFTVIVEVDNALHLQPLLPGTSVEARVSGPIQRDSILLPRTACMGGRIFVAKDGFAKKRHVNTERFVDDRALVTGDIAVGDLVIISRLEHLTDGAPVKLAPETNDR